MYVLQGEPLVVHSVHNAGVLQARRIMQQMHLAVLDK